MTDTAQRAVKILLLDDHALFRESVARFLAGEPGFEVVAHCSTIEDSLAALDRASVDIVLLDIDLGRADGRDFLRAAREHRFDGKVLVVTAGIDNGQAAELVRSGISGIFMKHESTASLVEGIHHVMAGRTWFQHDLLQSSVAQEESHPEPEGRRLTNRERQVLSYVLQGLINKEIADRLGVSESAVKATLQQLFSKTGVRTRSQLVRIALEQYRDQI